MSSYVTKKIECKCCLKEYEAKVLKGFYQNCVPDLDTNPHNPAIYDRVVICPECGYATMYIKEQVEDCVKEEVYSQSYQLIYRDDSLDTTYKKLVLAAKVSEAKQKYGQAAYEWLMVSWHLSVKQMNVIEFLEKAITNYSKYLENNMDFQAAIILIDCLRRCERFAEAKETAESLAEYAKEEQVIKVIDYELLLISKNDSMPHSLSEV